MRLEGKVAVVTGGGSGIGQGIVMCMAREAADVAIRDIQEGQCRARGPRGQRVADVIPMKREQTPEDIGRAAVFLASDRARNITGQALNVNADSVMH